MLNFIPVRKPSFLRYLIPALPILEIVGFVAMGAMIGLFPTLLLILATSMLGGYVLQTKGTLAVWRLNQRMAEHKAADPAEMLNASFTMLAGMLLLLPGFITDFFGLFLLIPFAKKALIRWIIKKNMLAGGPKAANESTVSGRVVEGECWDEDEPK